MNAEDIAFLRQHMTQAERDELDALLVQDIAEVIWRPLPGPQSLAYDSVADIIGYGGAAGGGKTDLAVGKALTRHHKVMILRREATQLQGVLDRFKSILGHSDGYNSQKNVWVGAGPRDVQIEFGSTPHLGDESKYQGRDHDLLVFDEAANFLEQQVRFLFGWVRSTRPGQHSQALLLFNPPTSVEGRWVIDFFAPWLDKNHPLYPQKSGTVLLVAMVPGENGVSKDVWVDRPDPFVIERGQLIYDFERRNYRPEDIITPQTRTFIASRISDNPYLLNSGYLRQLQGMPEPLRSQMLNGDFSAGMEDDPWQVIPSLWVKIAMARWRDRFPKGELMSLGVDVARGGKDNTTIAKRYTSHWYDRIKSHPGSTTPNGSAVAGLVMAEQAHKAPIHIDVIGVGASPFDKLVEFGQPVLGVNVSEKATSTDRSGRLKFFNLRSQLWWQMREDLDPENDTGIALPPDPALEAELCAPKWELSGMTIKVQSRDEIIERTGRSPDRASALILARIDTPKMADMERTSLGRDEVVEYDPYR